MFLFINEIKEIKIIFSVSKNIKNRENIFKIMNTNSFNFKNYF
jgi:hypothetical protein